MLTFSVKLEIDWRAVRKAIAAGNKKALRKIGKEIVSAEKRALGSSTAAVSGPGEVPKSKTGNLRKSMAYELRGMSALIVGARGGPGQLGNHAHLLRYGTKSRRTKSGKFTGRAAPRKFPVPQNELGIDLAAKWSGAI